MTLLHDFFHTPRHTSKIYVEIDLEDKDIVTLLRNHHLETQNEMLLLLKKNDRSSASITRPSYKSPRPDRYNWQSRKKVDFSLLAKQIANKVNEGVWKLYRFIYENNDLSQLNESLDHGHTSLQRHLLIMANLIVNDLISYRIRFLSHQKAT